jgi:hypothetical protein
MGTGFSNLGGPSFFFFSFPSSFTFDGFSIIISWHRHWVIWTGWRAMIMTLLLRPLKMVSMQIHLKSAVPWINLSIARHLVPETVWSLVSGSTQVSNYFNFLGLNSSSTTSRIFQTTYSAV